MELYFLNSVIDLSEKVFGDQLYKATYTNSTSEYVSQAPVR